MRAHRWPQGVGKGVEDRASGTSPTIRDLTGLRDLPHPHQTSFASKSLGFASKSLGFPQSPWWAVGARHCHNAALLAWRPSG